MGGPASKQRRTRTGCHREELTRRWQKVLEDLVRFGSARLGMMSLGGLSVALALVLLPGSGEALREGECEGRMLAAS